MKSKSIGPTDYEEQKAGLRILNPTIALSMGAGVAMYIPHPHRMWEYSGAIQAYLDQFGPDKVTKVLDLGCGRSPLGPGLAKFTNAVVHEVDSDERLVEDRQAVTKLLHLPEGKHGFTNMDLLDVLGSYDAVFSISVIEHVPEDKQNEAWIKLANLVAPGGLLFVSTDYGEDRTRSWHSDSERVFKFDPERAGTVAGWLRDLGFHLELDLTYHGHEVFNHSFFRWVARRTKV